MTYGLCEGIVCDGNKLLLIQIGGQFFYLSYWGKLKGKNKSEEMRDLKKMLDDKRFKIKLIKEE